jgi:hypothetical protein
MTDNVTLPGAASVIASDDIGGAQYQRIKLIYGADGLNSGDVSATNPFPISMNASTFMFSTNNSSSTELASNATFTGTIETALNQPAISLLLTSDQPITLTIKQYIDVAGTYAAPPIVYYVAANTGFSGSFPLNGNYIQVTAKNTGTATTTTFELNTAYGTIDSSDGTGRLPISKADCIPVLAQTMVAAGNSTTIDTIGYGAIVIQLSGVWSGSGYFEGSNNGTDWDSVLTFSRDSLCLQDLINSGGLYTVRPSGRYLRFNLTQITGSLAINAIGRAAEGIAASDLLSLAMDRNNNTPLQVQLNGTKQDAQGGLMLADGSTVYTKTLTNIVDFIVIDTLGYASLSVNISNGVGNATVEYSNDMSATTWFAPVGAITSTSSQGNGVLGITSNTGFNAPAPYSAVVSASWGRYIRVRLSVYTSGTPIVVAYLRSTPVPQAAVANQTIAGAVTATGSAAEDATAGTSPVISGGVVRTAVAPTTLIAGDTARHTMSSAAQLITKPYSMGDTDWQFTTAGLTTTTAVAAKAAGAASVRNYVTDVTVQNTNATATTFLIQDGATTIWQVSLPVSMTLPITFAFKIPLRGTAATALNVNCGTAAANVVCNVSGYQSL